MYKSENITALISEVRRYTLSLVMHTELYSLPDNPYSFQIFHLLGIQIHAEKIEENHITRTAMLRCWATGGFLKVRLNT